MKQNILTYLDDVECNFLEEREIAIRKIEKDIFNINEIMVDLSNMIQAQEEVLESIESNIINTKENTKKGTENLEKAENIQKSMRSIKNLITSALFSTITNFIKFTIK